MSRCTLAQAVRFGVVLAALLLPRSALTQSIWVPTDLGTLGGGFSSAADINATAQVVGQSDTASGRHAFIWTAATGMVDLGTLGGQTSTAVAINNAGQVIGQSQTADVASHAFLWTASGGMVDLGQMTVTGINNVGQIVGTVNGRAFLRMASGAMVDLGTLGGSSSQATAINDVGQVIGTSAIADGTERAFMWTAEGGMVNLAVPTHPAAMNNAGQIVGSYLISFMTGNVYEAYSWTAAGGRITLRCGTGSRASADTGSGAYDFDSSIAYDVNNAGQVVGYTTLCGGGPMHAFIWTAATGMVNLSAPFYPNSASAINDAGQIVGASGFAGVGSHAVLWQLVPLPPLSVTALTPNVTFPVPAGTPATWTASATDGVAPYTFQFWVFNGTTWTLGRDWSASASWTWEPPLPGNYIIQVWARNKGSSADYDAWRGASATISMPSVLTITSVFTSVPSVPAGTDVTWTATVAGGSGTGPYTYKFFVYDGTTWTVGQEWSTANTWVWTPTKPGTYLFQAWLRNAGSASAYDAWRTFGPYTATRPASLTVTALAPDLAFPVPAGTPVTWTATAAGGTAPYVYKFFLFDGAAWTVGQDWSASERWTWLPTSTGSYAVQAWVKNAGSVAPYDASRSSSAMVTTPTVLRATGFRADHAFPVPAGTPVRWTARAIGGMGPYTFRFWVFDGTTWTVGRDWSPSDSWTWIPPSAGSYFVQAWMRNVGSLSAYDAWAGTTSLSVSSPTALAVTTTVAPMAPLFAREAATLTATATGGTGPYAYQFWVAAGSDWTIGQAWSGSNTFTWRPPGVSTFWIQVWVRNAGSTSSYDAWTGLGPLKVLP